VGRKATGPFFRAIPFEGNWLGWISKKNVHFIEVVKTLTWAVELGIAISMVTSRLVMEIFTFVKRSIS
jgi:hypothetical protein